MIEKKSYIRKFGNSVCVIIPSDIWKDSTNKLKVGQEVNVKLSEGGREIKVG